MGPCGHTKLMNYIIGMCKKHRNWISVLADLGYDPQIIEQQIRMQSGETVKPDIIAASNKMLHSLVFECKGGTTLNSEQLERYAALTQDDLRRWITVFDPENLQFDICVTDLEENHPIVAKENQEFPMITFAPEEVFKTRSFKVKGLNDALSEPVSLKGKQPPLSYYPFCEEDENTYIAPFILRGLVSVAVKKAKGGPSASEENLVSRDDLVKSIFNPVFDALSRDHQTRLKEKIREVVRGIMAKDDMKEALGIIEQQAGIKISRQLDRFTIEAEKFVKFLETQRPLVEFIDKKEA